MYGEDPTTVELEARLARLTGKEAALFCSSGTMTNQLGIRAHLQGPPHSIICDHRAHIHLWEAGGIALFNQATTHALVPRGKFLTAKEVERNLHLGNDHHIAPTRLICLENTMNGVIYPQDEVVKIGELAKEHNIPTHLDGARIWNVAADEVEAQNLDSAKEEDIQAVMSKLLEPFDTASICLSKGIGAPIGS